VVFRLFRTVSTVSCVSGTVAGNYTDVLRENNNSANTANHPQYCHDHTSLVYPLAFNFVQAFKFKLKLKQNEKDQDH